MAQWCKMTHLSSLRPSLWSPPALACSYNSSTHLNHLLVCGSRSFLARAGCATAPWKVPAHILLITRIVLHLCLSWNLSSFSSSIPITYIYLLDEDVAGVDLSEDSTNNVPFHREYCSCPYPTFDIPDIGDTLPPPMMMFTSFSLVDIGSHLYGKWLLVPNPCVACDENEDGMYWHQNIASIILACKIEPIENFQKGW